MSTKVQADSRGWLSEKSPERDMAQILEQVVRCPRCFAVLKVSSGDRSFCCNPECRYSEEGFFKTNGQPVLIDFSQSIVTPADIKQSSEQCLQSRDDERDRRVRVDQLMSSKLRLDIQTFITGRNPVVENNCRCFCRNLKEKSSNPLVLVVGGGTLGFGTDPLYQDRTIQVIGTDIYASANTQLVSDGHSLPFADESFDGVWIQAVLEHVLEPHIVVNQIWRVLKPGGLVYAETPFMQQVHLGPYDFTRFTLSGHRWLFRRFQQIDAGTVMGAGTAAVWAIRYVWRSLGVGNKLATLLTIPFFWLRFLDAIAKRRPNADAASGFYFFGRKSEQEIHAPEIVRYYDSLEP